MKCPICRKSHKSEHHPHYQLMAQLNDSGFPVDTPDYLKELREHEEREEDDSKALKAKKNKNSR